jgi:hypothetical protein
MRLTDKELDLIESVVTDWPTGEMFLKAVIEIRASRKAASEVKEVLTFYGYKIVPASLNAGFTEITTAIGYEARRALENPDVKAWLSEGV